MMNITTDAANGGPWEWRPLGMAAWYHIFKWLFNQKNCL